MKNLEKLKEALCEELDKFGKSGDITVNSLDKIHRLTDTIKNIDKIMALEAEEVGYSEGYIDDGMMYGSSYSKGRRYAKRDSMGRYSSEGGSYERGASYDDGYSRAKDDMMMMLGEMMEDADPKQREALKKCMRELKRD